MKREQISEAVGGISTRFIEEAGGFSKKRHTFFAPGLAAAAVALAVLLGVVMAPGAGDSFAVKAYALDLDDSGALVLREEDLLEKSDYWGGYQDGENIYINLGFRYEGTNLQNVTFTTEDGFFAAQRITPDLADSVMKAYAGPENRLIVFGRDFEALGSTVTFAGGEMEEDLLLFWAVREDCSDDVPKNPRITATATFKSGKTQTIDLHPDLSGMGFFVRSADAGAGNEASPAYRKSRYYRSLPLEECEMVDRQAVTDAYTYTIGDYTITLKVPEEQVFDEDGVYRSRRLRISGAFYLPVFQKDGDAVTAQLYRVPEELEFSEENEKKLGLRQAEDDVPSPTAPAPSEETPAVALPKPEAAAPSAQSTEATPTEGPAPKPPEPEVPPITAKDTGKRPSKPHHIYSDEEWDRISTYYHSLPLENCELVDEQPMTDIYWVKNTVSVQVPDDTVFDKDGYYRPVLHICDEGVFLGVAYRDADGERWGRTYRVPDDLVYVE